MLCQWVALWRFCFCCQRGGRCCCQAGAEPHGPGNECNLTIVIYLDFEVLVIIYIRWFCFHSPYSRLPLWTCPMTFLGASCVEAENVILVFDNFFLSYSLSLYRACWSIWPSGGYLHVPEVGGTLFHSSVPDHQSLPGQPYMWQCIADECCKYATKYIGVPNL